MLLSLFIITIFFALNFFLRNDDYLITQVETGNYSEIKNIVDQQLAGSYLGIFPKANKFVYPKERIKNKIKTELPNIKDVTFSLKNDELKVEVIEYPEQYFWCQKDDNCYAFLSFLENKGLIANEVNYVDSPDVKISIDGDAGANWYIIYEAGENADNLIKNFSAILLADTLKDKNLNDLEYIDMRFGNKIYYKWSH